MKRYLVSVFTSQSYFKWIDAGSEDEAKKLAKDAWKNNNMNHGCDEEISEIYVVEDEDVCAV